MLKATKATPARINVAQGTIVEHCCQFESDTNLNGLKVAVDLGLFLDTSTVTGKLSPAYQVNYPYTGSGTVTMTLVGTSDIWKNLQVLLTAIDSKNFVVQVKFCQLADLDQYLGNTSFDNYQYFTGQGVGGYTTVYDAIKQLSVKVTVQKPGGLDVAVCDTDWKAVAWCTDPSIYYYTDYFTTDNKSVQGWVSGEDLTVSFLVSGNYISSRWYGGIIRASSNNNDAWFNDLRLQYGELNEFVSLVDLNFDTTYLTASQSLLGDQLGNYYGTFTIDKDYFVDGESYHVFVIYEEEGVLKSCLAPIIQEQINNTLPELDFDTTNTIEVVDNPDLGVIPTSCIQNVAPCQELEVCTTIDIPSFDAALTAAGLPYTLHELRGGSLTGQQAEVTIYGTEYLQVDSPNIFGDTILSSTYTENVSWLICGGFTIPESWAGTTKYIFIKLKLALPGGEYYEIIFPFTLSVVDWSTTLVETATPPQFICEDAEDEVFCFDGVDSDLNFIAKYNGELVSDTDFATADPDFTGGDACLTVDYTKIEFEREYCFCLIAQGATSDSPSPGTCDCGDVEFSFTLYSEGGQTLMKYEVDLSTIIPIPTGSKIIVTTSILPGFFEYEDTDTFTLYFKPPLKSGETITVNVLTVGGCAYLVTAEIPLDGGTVIVNACPTDSGGGVKSVPCDADPSLLITCGGGDTWEANLVDGGGTVTLFEYTFDFTSFTDYTVPVSFGSETEIYVHAIIDFGGTCGIKELWAHATAAECGECYDDLPPINSCPSFLDITQDWDEVTDLLTLIDTNDSASCASPVDSGIEYSYDGVTYEPYTEPISTMGYDVVYYQWYYACDSCADVVASMWTRPDDGCCDPSAEVNICELLNTLTLSPPPFGAKFVYLDTDNQCYIGEFNLCVYLNDLDTDTPVSLDGLYFAYVDSEGNCFKADISSFIGGGSQAALQMQDEGSNLGTAGTVTEVNYVGAGVTATRVSNKITVTIPDWQSKIQWKDQGTNLGASGTVTTVDFLGTFVEASRVSNTVFVDLGPYETWDDTGSISHVATQLTWFYYIADPTPAAATSFFLPAAAANGSLVYIKKITNSAQPINVIPDGTDNLEGSNSNFQITAYNQVICLKSDLDNNTGWHIVSDYNPSLVNYTDEQAQDAVGTILVDTNDIDLAYNDGTPSITATILKTVISSKTAVTAVGTDYVLIADTSDSDNLKKTLISDFANATHTGEVTGSGALTLDKTAISNRSAVTPDGADYILIGDSSDSNNLKKVLISDLPSGSSVGAFEFIIQTTSPGTQFPTGIAGRIRAPFALTITKVSLFSDQTTSTVLDLWVDIYANYPPTVADTITAAAKPTLSSAIKNEDSTLTGWTTSVASGSIIMINVDSNTDSEQLTLVIEYSI